MSSRREPASATLLSRYWIPVAAYVALIALVSHQPNLRPPMPDLWFIQADKLAHVAEYSILGFLLARAWRATLTGSGATARAVIAIVCGIALGAIDEYHQSFVPGRDSNAYDLLADTAGVTLAQLLHRAWSRG